ncbi:MAG: antA/AntB antirepressor family protein [Nitrosomonas sp.]|uniref:antA/AntB antirepressor family protein n=1 Tax=Nitrosomonas sp. TaxID=42353 RepID=UPI0025F01851|nr:antA/AntB antirepressor family protein [Nitrosomonas sp.]MBY0475436.1 antA/AntB antirepressor family protein [Nitrosomonas sp.]
MNELIKLTNTTIGDETVSAINARELHGFLKIGKDFSNWIKDRIDQYGFVENQDFSVFAKSGENSSGGRPQKEYAISLDMAKEISMVERNAKGKEARQYFIECERRSKSSVIDPIKALSNPEIMRGLLLSYSEKVITLESKVEELSPKANALDRIATHGEGSFCVRDAAKTLQIQEKKLRQLLIAEKWLYRRPMGSELLAYSDKLRFGLMEHKITKVERDDGSERIFTQARITAKGLARLSMILASSNPGQLFA